MVIENAITKGESCNFIGPASFPSNAVGNVESKYMMLSQLVCEWGKETVDMLLQGVVTMPTYGIMWMQS